MKGFESVESVLIISGTHLWKCSVVKSGPCMIPCEAAPAVSAPAVSVAYTQPRVTLL